jgi:hypothetical protein
MKRITLIVLLSGMLASCFDELPDTEKPGISFDKETFDRERAIWNKNNYRNYSVLETIQNDGIGFYKARIIVKNGVIVDVQDPSDDREMVPDHLKTISEILESLEHNYNEHKSDIRNGIREKIVIDAAYDSSYHYPKRILFNLTLLDTKSQPIGGGRAITSLSNFVLNPQ